MFKADLICEVCQEEPQFRTVEADFNGEKKKLNVCMDCDYAIEEMEQKEQELIKDRQQHLAENFDL